MGFDLPPTSTRAETVGRGEDFLGGKTFLKEILEGEEIFFEKKRGRDFFTRKNWIFNFSKKPILKVKK